MKNSIFQYFSSRPPSEPTSWLVTSTLTIVPWLFRFVLLLITQPPYHLLISRSGTLPVRSVSNRSVWRSTAEPTAVCLLSTWPAPRRSSRWIRGVMSSSFRRGRWTTLGKNMVWEIFSSFCGNRWFSSYFFSKFSFLTHRSEIDKISNWCVSSSDFSWILTNSVLFFDFLFKKIFFSILFSARKFQKKIFQTYIF